MGPAVIDYAFFSYLPHNFLIFTCATRLVLFPTDSRTAISHAHAHTPKEAREQRKAVYICIPLARFIYLYFLTPTPMRTMRIGKRRPSKALPTAFHPAPHPHQKRPPARLYLTTEPTSFTRMRSMMDRQRTEQEF